MVTKGGALEEDEAVLASKSMTQSPFISRIATYKAYTII